MNNKSDITAAIIYLKDDMLISKRQFKDWREAQTYYGDDYKASMPPMNLDEIIEFLYYEYGDTQPFSKDELINFFNSDSEALIWK